MHLRDGGQPTKAEHSIPRKAAGEARRQEPPRCQKTRGGIKSRQLWGEEKDAGTEGSRRRAETTALSTVEWGRCGRNAGSTRTEEERKELTSPLSHSACR